jgi:hypothetical protein
MGFTRNPDRTSLKVWLAAPLQARNREVGGRAFMRRTSLTVRDMKPVRSHTCHALRAQPVRWTRSKFDSRAHRASVSNRDALMYRWNFVV